VIEASMISKVALIDVQEWVDAGMSSANVYARLLEAVQDLFRGGRFRFVPKNSSDN
jgi:hypothetical protein